MKIVYTIITLLATFAFIGCARVDVGGTEKPIKVDVTMRVDIYQHVVKQADDIESMVRGTEEPKQETEGPQSFLNFFVKDAWAADLSPEVTEAVEGRKSRLAKVNELLSGGIVGENNQGLLAVRQSVNAEAQDTVSAENANRETIYKSLAEQNGVTVDSIKEIYAEKMQSLAPSGSSVQDKEGNWVTK